ncbi:MAG: lytic transglycosylase domain-containing protein [Burkholderiaceae bacterium]|nr:lytic transglycosylase domain-containing protein [Burkholderiaceae bacterium]
MAFATTWANAFCFAEAAQRYGVDERLLMAIAKQESDFKPHATHTNENGSVDVGLMQINSQHFKTLRRFNITEQSLLDPCVNVGRLGALSAPTTLAASQSGKRTGSITPPKFSNTLSA